MSSSSTLKYFVGGVPSSVRHKDLYDFFKKYGVVKRITVFNSDSSKKLFGFCFVKFKKVYGGELDLANTDFIFQGRKLEIDHIIRRSNLKQSVQEKHSRRVFLQNVPASFDKADLIRVFSPFGSIANCFTISRETNTNDAKVKGDIRQAAKYGYVIFHDKEDAELLLQRRFVEINNKTKIYVKRYCSTINRLTSEGEKAFGKPLEPVNSEDKHKRSAVTLSNDDKLKRTAPQQLYLHHVKPTSKGYLNGVCRMDVEKGANLRFNISLH